MSQSLSGRAASSLPSTSKQQVKDLLTFYGDHLPRDVWLQEDSLYVRNFLIQEKRAFLKEFNAFDQQTEKAKWTVVHPRYDHTCTVILLHERGEFPQSLATRLFESPMGWDLRVRAPEIKWVFPKAPASLNRFGQQPMWFGDRDSLDYRQDIEQNAAYLNSIVEEEAKILRGGTDQILIGGVQQGATMALHSLLKLCTHVRGVVSVGGWLDLELIPEDTYTTRRITRHRSAVLHTPVFALHDRLDEVVSTDKFHRMLAAMHARGLEVGHIETEANRMRTVNNAPIFKANTWETQIIRALSGLQKTSDQEHNDQQRGSGLGHGEAIRSRYKHRNSKSCRLSDFFAAPFGELSDPGTIDYSLGRVPSKMASVRTSGLFKPVQLEDVVP